MLSVELLKEKYSDSLYEIDDLKTEISMQKIEIYDLKEALKDSEELISKYEEKLKQYEDMVNKPVRTNCWICGSPMIWSNDFSYEDFGIDEHDGFVAVLNCSHCNTQAEFYHDLEEIDD